MCSPRLHLPNPLPFSNTSNALSASSLEGCLSLSELDELLNIYHSDPTPLIQKEWPVSDSIVVVCLLVFLDKHPAGDLGSSPSLRDYHAVYVFASVTVIGW
jgi:hypothetical protein